LAVVAGPLLIVAAVLVVMHSFWLSPRLTSEQVDLLAFWMPRFCAMGKAVAHGHIPTWLPNQFGGVPFASDPQSGWLYLPVFALFSGLSCARALGAFLTLQPLLAGLGLYWFFRNEGTGPSAATVGGLTLAMSMTGSVVVLSVPFAGTLAWTAMALAGASAYLHARMPVAVVAWLGFTALALSQVAAAHLTDGLLIALVIVGLYVVGRVVAQVRAGERRWQRAVGAAVALFAAFPFLAAAIILPRLALLPHTSIGIGYQELGRLANQLSGTNAPPPLYLRGVGPWWGTSFARGPGGYVGVLAILLVPAAFAIRRWRWPAAGFAVAGLVGWLLNLDGLIASQRIRTFALAHRIGELWLRSPYRFRYLTLFAFAALVGYGVQAWIEMAKDRQVEGRAAVARRMALWLGPGLLVFGVLPLVAGARLADDVPFALGLLFAVPLLILVARGRLRAAIVLPVVVAVELTVTGLVGQLGPAPRNAPDRLEAVASSGLGHSFPKFHAPSIAPADYLMPGPIGRALEAAAASGDHGRYLSYSPHLARTSPRGFLFHQDPSTWPAYANGRSILFGLEEVQGYSPVQLDRYWRLVRSIDRKAPIFYNSATLQRDDPSILSLFGVEWVVQPRTLAPPANATRVAREGRWDLWRLHDSTPRANLVFCWRDVGPSRALRIVRRPSFDPSTQALVESRSYPVDNCHPPEAVRVDARALSPEHLVIGTGGGRRGVLVVRNTWAPGWTATVDGRPASILPTNYAFQGVFVPKGQHTVQLKYHDPAIGQGLLISGVAWLLWALALVVAGRRQHRVPSAAVASATPAPPSESTYPIVERVESEER
jgi:hypothetical protein